MKPWLVCLRNSFYAGKSMGEGGNFEFIAILLAVLLLLLSLTLKIFFQKSIIT